MWSSKYVDMWAFNTQPYFITYQIPSPILNQINFQKKIF